MEFIKAEEFLKQPKEIQQIFLDWWKENATEFDLLGYTGRCKAYKDSFPSLVRNVAIDCFELMVEIIPLFTEGQLRQFIEDKINSKIEVVFIDKEGVENEESYYRIERVHYLDGNLNNSVWITEKNDLLQAYWKVALEVAKGETKNADTM